MHTRILESAHAIETQVALYTARITIPLTGAIRMLVLLHAVFRCTSNGKN